jgi:hypothetical protein
MGRINTTYPVYFTLDKNKILDDVEFIVLSYLGEQKSKCWVGQQFGYGEYWVNSIMINIHNKFSTICPQGAIDKAWKEEVFTKENRVINTAWKQRSFFIYPLFEQRNKKK